MTTSEVNAKRLNLFNGEFATELVAATRNRLRHPRVIAVGRSAKGGAFQVVTAPLQAPADFAAAVAEVDSRQALQWTAAQHDAVDGEKVGEEFSRSPFLY